MYAAYHDRGFEIVGISIDSTPEDWKLGVEDNELPWINLGDVDEHGEMKGSEAPAATTFGVDFLPKGFLIDSEGCIVNKDFTVKDLKRELKSRWQ